MSLQEIMVRRTCLLQRIAQQRVELGTQAQSLRRSSDLFDKGYNLARKIRLHHKLVLSVALLSLMVLRKRMPITKLGVTALTVASWWLSLRKPEIR